MSLRDGKVTAQFCDQTSTKPSALTKLKLTASVSERGTQHDRPHNPLTNAKVVGSVTQADYIAQI